MTSNMVHYEVFAAYICEQLYENSPLLHFRVFAFLVSIDRAFPAYFNTPHPVSIAPSVFELCQKVLDLTCYSFYRKWHTTDMSSAFRMPYPYDIISVNVAVYFLVIFV